MGRLAIVLQIAFMIATATRADELSDIAAFTESVCNDTTPTGPTRENIKGKVAGKVDVLAKIITGGSNVSDSHAQEIYKGIPFDKLPEHGQTVSMCKSNLADLIFEQKHKIQFYSGNNVNIGGNNNDVIINVPDDNGDHQQIVSGNSGGPIINGNELTPLREYLRSSDIPPAGRRSLWISRFSI